MMTTPSDATSGSLGAVFVSSARAHAAATAIVCPSSGQTVTYGELLHRGEALADVLLGLGISTGDVVIIPDRRRLSTVVAMIGVVLAGGAYLPAPAPLTASRQAALIASCQPRAVITDIGWSAEKLACVELDDRGVVLRLAPAAGESQPRPRQQGRPIDVGYVMFTSGTTGAAKAVAVAGAAIVNLVRGQHYARFGPTERAVWSSPATFDASTFELWSALLHGGSLLIAADEPLTAAGLRTLIREYGATTVWLSAGLFDVITSCDVESFGGIGQVLTGGDIVSATAARRFSAAHPDATLIIGYGPTETTTFATAGPVGSADIAADSLTLGYPLAGVSIEIRDESDTAATPGTVGEIVIGGRGVAHGYLGGSEREHSEGFIVDADGQHRFRTGDYGLIRPDGRLEFRGRRDRQVKIRGHRIELDYVERVLGEITGVRQAAVVTDGESAAARRIAAFVVPALDGPAVRERIQGTLATQLPTSHLPTVWRWISALPLTAPGKVDRATLGAQLNTFAPRPAQQGKGGGTTTVPIANVVSSLWVRWLSCPPPHEDADFFACGGDSLRAIGLLGDLESSTGITLPVSVLYQGRTLAALIEALGQPRETMWSAAVPLRPARLDADRGAAYFVHGLSGDVFGFHAVADKLRFKGPVWGLRGLSDAAGAPGSIAEIARFYVDVVDALTPTGTVYLIGYSAGGVVAVTMAALMAAQRRRPALIMLDTCPPAHWAPSDSFGPARPEPESDVAEAAALAETGAYGTRRVQFMQRFGAALAGSAPVVTTAPAALLDSSVPRMHEPDPGWGRWLTDIRVAVKLTGDHHSILRDPHAARTAAAIDDCITATNDATNDRG